MELNEKKESSETQLLFLFLNMKSYQMYVMCSSLSPCLLVDGLRV